MTEEQKSTVEILLANRLYAYSLLYKAFAREPDAELLNLLTAESAGEAFALLGSADDTLARAPAFFAELRGELDEAFVSEAKSEFTRLFLGPIKLVAPPWESVYIGKETMLFQESTLAVRRFYQRYGLQPEACPRVADDSLALELAFMNRLAERACSAFGQEKREELLSALNGSCEFLTEHMLVWIPRFLERMSESPSNVLYPQLCRILSAFLSVDREVLTEMMGIV
ncbi:MAG: molecular chaperone TorD family protein [Oscillospiraceae bacterium]|nr:molecular chaperone TorD family protein [Oscillospiraceae bacterium]